MGKAGVTHLTAGLAHMGMGLSKPPYPVFHRLLEPSLVGSLPTPMRFSGFQVFRFSEGTQKLTKEVYLT